MTSWFPGQDLGDMPRRDGIRWAKEVVLESIDTMINDYKENKLHLDINYSQLEELQRQRNRVVKFLRLADIERKIL